MAYSQSVGSVGAARSLMFIADILVRRAANINTVSAIVPPSVGADGLQSSSDSHLSLTIAGAARRRFGVA